MERANFNRWVVTCLPRLAVPNQVGVYTQRVPMDGDGNLGSVSV